jgi:peptidoglycan LD-endopeptidase LytH
MKKLSFLFFLLLTPLFISGCKEIGKVFSDKSPHEEYKLKLAEAGLLKTDMGRAWIAASENSLTNFIEINLPFNGKGYFFPDKPDAYSYKFKGVRGEKIFIEFGNDSTNYLNLFADLFSAEETLERVAYADSNWIELTLDKTTEFILRLQPELLSGGSFDLNIGKGPSVHFPVEGKNSRAVQSFFGDSRDGGKRDHKGVDIFAPKGTPVVAAVDGIVTRTGTNNLGGKVVWLSNLSTNYYYAHLDSQLVSPAAVVKAGDTLGIVGNTGNARYTPPHLHFGIYIRGEGAVDPYPFVKNTFPDPVTPVVKGSVLGEWGRIKSHRADFFLSAGKNKSSSLDRSTPFKIIGGIGKWIKIVLADNTKGFVASNQVEGINRPITKRVFSPGSEILNNPAQTNDIVEMLSEQTSLPIHGEFDQYYLITYKDRFLWINKKV